MRRLILAALAATLVAGTILPAGRPLNPTSATPPVRAEWAAGRAPAGPGARANAPRLVLTPAAQPGAPLVRERRTEPRGIGNIIKKIRKFLKLLRGVIDEILDHTTDGPSGGGGGIVKNGMDHTEALAPAVAPPAIPGWPADAA